MHLLVWLSLINALICGALAIIVYQRNPHDKINQSFFVCLIMLAWVLFSEFGYRQASSYLEAFFWLKIHSFWPISVSLLLYFTFVLTKQSSLLKSKLTYVFIYAGAFVFTISELILTVPKQASWGWINDTLLFIPLIYTLMIIWEIIVALFCIILPLHAYFKKEKDQQMKKYLILWQSGVILPMVFGMIADLAQKLFFSSIPIPDITTSFIGLGALIVGFAAIRTELFELTPKTAAKSILSTISDILLLIDKNLIIVSTNQATLEILGFSESEITNKPLDWLIDQSQDKIITLSKIQVLVSKKDDQTDTLRDIEANFRRKDNSSLPVSLTVSRILDEAEQVTGVVCLARDITSWRKTQESLTNELESAEEKYKEIFESVQSGLFRMRFDKKTPEILFNPAIQTMLHFDSLEDIIASVTNFPEDIFVDTDEFHQLVNSLQKKGSIQGFKTQIFCKNKKQKIWVKMNIGVVYDSDKRKIIGYEGTIVDITKELLAEKAEKLAASARIELELAKKRIEFMRMTSHELKNPLSIISGYVSILKNKLDLSGEQEHWFKVIERNLQRIEKMTRDFYNITQIEMGTFKLDFQEVDFIEFVYKIIKVYKNLFKDQFEFQISQDESVKVRIDITRINQVFDNLIQNAINHTNDVERKIRVEMTHSDKIVKIKIIDNGAGIPPENIPVIFDLYTTFGSEYHAVGSGLGLYMSKTIIEGHGGRIDAFSRGKECGTTITIELPRMN